MVKLSCLLLKSIVEPYNASQHMYLCMHHTSHVSFSHLTQNFPHMISHSESTSHLSHMYHRTLYLTFYGYFRHDMVNLLCLWLESIVEPYSTSQHMYICISHTAHIPVFHTRIKKKIPIVMLRWVFVCNHIIL